MKERKPAMRVNERASEPARESEDLDKGEEFDLVRESTVH